MHTTVVTPQMAKVRDIADDVLSSSDGVTVVFTVERYGDLKGSHAAARGLQVAFSALRSRARRLSAQKSGVPDYERDSFVRGPYDGISCELRPLPNNGGHKIIFSPHNAYGMEFEVIDNATGLPREKVNPIDSRLTFIIGKIVHEDAEAKKYKRMLQPVLTEEEREFLWEHAPAMFEDYPIRKPQSVIDAEMPSRAESDYESVDLATLGEDELEIVNPPKSE